MEIGERIAGSLLKGPSRPDLCKEETLADIFRSTAKRIPDKPALIFQGNQITYSELDTWSDSIAGDLTGAGIHRGDKVVVWWHRGLELHAAILGIIKAGAAYIPVDREMPAERVELVISQVKAKAYFSNYLLNTDSSILSIKTLQEALAAPTSQSQEPDPDNCAYVLYTSGSTGKPKGIPISHRQICHLIRAENTVLEVQEKDKVYQGFSVSFDMWCEETWISYLAGATLWVADVTTSKAIDELADVLNKERISVLHAVPSLLAVMDGDVPSLRLINAGGEACTPQVVDKWALPSRQFFNSYGPTETTVTATIAPLHPGEAITIGYPLPNYNVAVVDEQLSLVPRGERGELVISGPGVASGYVDLPELTKSKFVLKPASLAQLPGKRIYRTGDAAIIHPDGNIEFQGRIDDQVKLRGFRIELGEIESRLSDLPNVSAAAAALQKDQAGQDHLVGYVIPSDTACMSEAEMRNELARILPSYMVPAVIVRLDEMPRMPSGKINRKALPVPTALLEANEESTAETIDLNAPLSSRMLAVLRRTFPGKTIDLSKDFFTDLGGHSLLAAGFISRLRREAGVTHASLKDIYTYRPLSALVNVWEQTPQLNNQPKKTFHRISPWRYYTCWLAQSLILLVTYGLYAVEIFTPYVSYYYVSEETDNHFYGVLAAIIFYCLLPPLYTFLIAAVKWLVIGKMKEGDYPLWGSYYLKWWTVKTLQRLVPAQYMGGTPVYPKFLRLFGAKVALNAQLSNIVIGAEDLVTIGSDASLSSQVVLNNAVVEDGLLKLRAVRLGDHCYIGSSAVIGGDTVISNYGELQDLSFLPPGSVIGEREVWQGSPAQLKETKEWKDLPQPLPVTRKQRISYVVLFLMTLFIFPFFILIPLFPIIVAIHELDNAAPDYNFDYIITVPALSTLYIVLFSLETILFTRLLNKGIRPGKFPLYSWLYMKKWLADQFFSMSLVVLHPVYATVYISTFYRAMGTKVGRNTEVSTASSVTHPLLELGDNAFIADAVTLGEADVRAQQLILEKTTISSNSFVGNSALIPQGYHLPSNMLIGVLSTPPSPEQLKNRIEKDWFGSPAIALPQRQQSNPFPAALTSEPTRARRLARAIIEFIRIILPETAIICFSIFFIAYGHDLIVDHPLSEIIILMPFYYLGLVGIPAFLVTVILKWLVIGKYKTRQKPMWSLPVWLSEATTTTYEALSVPYLLDFLRGTPWLPLALQLLGTKMGRRVWMNTTDITEFDLVSIGTDAALNEDCGPQTHLFEDRVMKTGKVKIGQRTSIGARSIVLYDTEVGNDNKIEALSLVMKGEVLAPDTDWTGSPIKPK